MKNLLILLSATFTISAVAQDTISYRKNPIGENDLKRWSHLDLQKDSIPGMSVDKAYDEFLKKKKSTTVIVGVIDSGVDINHKDLKGKIWKNKGEKPNNGKDDDGNGYIDDVYGWNFLGESNNENFEFVRIIKKGDDGSETYKKAMAEYEMKYNEIAPQKEIVDFIVAADKTIREHLKKDNYTVEDLENISSVKYELFKSKKIMLSFVEQTGKDIHKELDEFKEYVYDHFNYYLNKEFDGRKPLGDNADDLSSTHYGNGNVYSKDRKDSLHGTHVAGIIAQVRDNKKGGDGVVENVKIMPLRVVPNGDEYDKDVALAIRYAADNGAKVINGSFGKDYSPHSSWVHDAIKYASSKDVLFVHAAGNDSKNIDFEPNFPNDVVDEKEIADNVLQVGALDYNYNANLVAPFSNFGKQNVDVFAPGVKIYATIPENQYKYEQGTSMAAPNAAGVAALIRSYYPNLSASQVKHILMESGTAVNFEVFVGENKEVVPFAQTCVSGKMVNAYNALKMAEKMSNKL